MADFSINIPDEYLSGSDDFGFTTVDSTEFEQRERQEREITSDVAEELASGLISDLNAKIEGLEGKLNAVLLRLEDPTDGEMAPPAVDMTRIESKLDQILSMENTEMLSALNSQGESIRAVIDEVEERKSQLDKQFGEKLGEVEKLVLPLLINLTKNPDQEYLYWPDRTDKVNQHIQKVLEFTRGGYT